MSRQSSILYTQQDRITRLSQQLSGLQSTLETDRVGRLDQLERRYQALEEQVWEVQEQTNKKINILREQVARLQKALEEERGGRESLMEQKMRDLTMLEQRIQQVLSQELGVSFTQTRKENELKLLKAIDDRSAALRGELLKETRSRMEAFEAIRTQIDQEVPKVSEGLKALAQEKEGLEASLTSAVKDEFQQVQNELMVERRAREESEEAMLAMLKDVVGRIKNDLEQERKDREATEETLLSLLEETCAKLNAVTQA